MQKAIKDYLDKQPSPQKEICTTVRKIMLETIPDVTEEFKNGVPWYGKFYIAGLKDSVNVGFSITGLSKEEIKQFKGAGKYMRHIKFKAVDEIDVVNLKTALRLVWEKASCYE